MQIGWGCVHDCRGCVHDCRKGYEVQRNKAKRRNYTDIPWFLAHPILKVSVLANWMWKGAKDEVQRNKAKRRNYTDYSLISCTSMQTGCWNCAHQCSWEWSTAHQGQVWEEVVGCGGRAQARGGVKTHTHTVRKRTYTRMVACTHCTSFKHSCMHTFVVMHTTHERRTQALVCAARVSTNVSYILSTNVIYILQHEVVQYTSDPDQLLSFLEHHGYDWSGL